MYQYLAERTPVSTLRALEVFFYCKSTIMNFHFPKFLSSSFLRSRFFSVSVTNSVYKFPGGRTPWIYRETEYWPFWEIVVQNSVMKYIHNQTIEIKVAIIVLYNCSCERTYMIFAAAVNVLAALKKDIDIKYANSVSAFAFLSILNICLKILSKRNWSFVLYLLKTFIIIWIFRNNFWSYRQISFRRAGPAGSKFHPQTKKSLKNSWPLKFMTQFVIKSISKVCSWRSCKDRVD